MYAQVCFLSLNMKHTKNNLTVLKNKLLPVYSMTHLNINVALCMCRYVSHDESFWRDKKNPLFTNSINKGEVQYINC